MPVAQLGRMPEHGRIRFGVRDGKAMRSIKTWRFTSADAEALATLAALHGGTVKPWSAWPDRANPGPPTFEVITNSSELAVFLPPASLSVHYELWTGGGLQRRCDGITAQVGQIAQPCVCSARQRMDCKPHSRLSVIIPEVRFAGTWRMETQGWNAAHQLTEMERTLLGLQEATRVPLRATLYLEARSQMVGGHKQNWMEPRLRLEASPAELVAGGGRVHQALDHPAPRALAGPSRDDDVIEAEVLEVRMDDWADKIRARFPATDLDHSIHALAAEAVTAHPWLQNDDHLLDALCRLISPHIEHWGMVSPGEKERLYRALLDIVTGVVEPKAGDDGGIKLVRRKA